MQDKLAGAGIELAGSELVSKRKPISEAIARAKESGCDTVLVGGGDGTIRRALGPAIDHQMTLGLLPLGTGNSLCNDLGIGALDDAVAAIKAGTARRIDVGRVGEHFFGNVVTLGASVKIAQQLQNQNKRLWGRLSYISAALRSYALMRPLHVTVESDQGEWTGFAFQLVVANGRIHSGRIPVGADATLESGHLEGYIVAGQHRSVLWQYGAALLTGRPFEAECTVPISGKSIRIHSRKPLRVIVDGDPVLRTPCEIECHANALSVLAPTDPT